MPGRRHSAMPPTSTTTTTTTHTSTSTTTTVAPQALRRSPRLIVSKRPSDPLSLTRSPTRALKRQRIEPPTAALAVPSSPSSKRRKKQLQPSLADPVASSSSTSSEEDERATAARVTTSARRKRKENTSAVLEAPTKRLRTRAVVLPPNPPTPPSTARATPSRLTRSSAHSRKTSSRPKSSPSKVVLVVARRSSPEPPSPSLSAAPPKLNTSSPPSSPSAFTLLASSPQRAPLDIIDLGPTLHSKPESPRHSSHLTLVTDVGDCGQLTPDSSMRNSPDATAAYVLPSWSSPPSPLTPLSTAPPSPTSTTNGCTSTPDSLESIKACAEQKEKEDQYGALSNSSMQSTQSLPSTWTSSVEEPPPSPLPITGPSTANESMGIDVDANASADQRLSLSSPVQTLSVGSSDNVGQQQQVGQVTYNARQDFSRQDMLSYTNSQPGQPQQLGSQLRQPQLQPQASSQPQLQQQQQQPSYGWYDPQIHEAQQQILYWEDPPRMEHIKSMWKYACKYRIWDVLCRYTPNIIRSVVAQEASDYHTVYGYPSGSLRLRPHRAQRNSTAGRVSGPGKRKRRRQDQVSDNDETGNDDNNGEDTAVDRDDKVVPEKGDGENVKQEGDSNEAKEAVHEAQSPEGEREKFMDEEYYDWEIRSDDEDDDADADVFYYDEYDEDDDGVYDDEDSDSEEEDDYLDEMEDVVEDGTDKATIENGSSAMELDNVDLTSEQGVKHAADAKGDSDKPKSIDARAEDDDPSFNAELTTSLSASCPTSPPPGSLQVSGSGPNNSAYRDDNIPLQAGSPVSSPKMSLPASPVPASPQCASTRSAAGGQILMSAFYCPPPHPHVHGQMTLPTQQQQMCQPMPQQTQQFTVEPAPVRPPTPAPSLTLSPAFGIGESEQQQQQPISLPASPQQPQPVPQQPTGGMAISPVLSPLSPLQSNPISPLNSIPMHLSMSLSNAPPAPPVLPLPPPRLSSIRVRPLRYGDLGLASVIGRGTPSDRTRAEQWARAGEWARSVKGKERAMAMDVVDERCERSGRVGDMCVEGVPTCQAGEMQEPRRDAESMLEGKKPSDGERTQVLASPDQEEGSEQEKMRIMETFEPDQAIWDAFFATLQADAGEEVPKQPCPPCDASAATAGGSNSGDRGQGPTSADLAGASAAATSTQTMDVSVTADVSVPASTGSGASMNMFGMGFGLGLGMGFVSGSVNHIALGFGGATSGVVGGTSPIVNSSTMGWFGSSPSPGSASAAVSPSPVNGAAPGYPNPGDSNMNGVQSYLSPASGSPLSLPLPLSPGGPMSMSMSIPMGMSISMPIPMSVPVSCHTVGAGDSGNNSQSSHGSATTVTSSTSGSSALSFALG
ncbi:hypothetical protein AX17_007468 [Amanita inopinata Kibby_2008]|nr:hypothetical protein AX17_007468 [Amanita inopinata Kibby_2008]